MTNQKIPAMMTIKEVAQTGLLNETCLRRMAKNKQLPAIYAGAKCLINFDKLVKQLENLPAEI